MLVSGRCDVRRGASNILLVAPHGGRRPRVDAANPPPNLRVNDIYTAALTRLLAGELQAGWIINEQLDRNQLDLNRVSQVLRRAAWFLELLHQEIAVVLERYRCAEVLFVHGWNVGQSRCDVGFGATESSDGLHVCDGSALTIGDEYRRLRIDRMRELGARRGIAVSVGAHYPASHPNNVLQLFTSQRRLLDHPAVAAFSDWSRERRVEALQLELGIPLRWPGPWRDNLVALLRESFGAEHGDTVPAKDRAAPPRAVPPPPSRKPQSLQLYDPRSDIGVLTGVGPIAPGMLGGRLLLFLGGQRVALFTGEQAEESGQGVSPLRIVDDGARMHVEFDGPILLLEDAATYLDLEAALVASRAVAARLRLAFDATHRCTDMRHGAVSGEVVIDGERRGVDCNAMAGIPVLRGAGGRSSTTLSVTFDCGTTWLARAVDGQAGQLWRFGDALGAAHQPLKISVDLAADGFTPTQFQWLVEDATPLLARPISRMAILRTTAAGYVRVSFGVARFEDGKRHGFGLYEHVVPLAR